MNNTKIIGVGYYMMSVCELLVRICLPSFSRTANEHRTKVYRAQMFFRAGACYYVDVVGGGADGTFSVIYTCRFCMMENRYEISRATSASGNARRARSAKPASTINPPPLSPHPSPPGRYLRVAILLSMRLPRSLHDAEAMRGPLR